MYFYLLFPIQIMRLGPVICIGKYVPKHVFFVKNENDPMCTSGGGQKWCILDDGDARRSKKHLFLDELAYRRQVSKNEGTYMGVLKLAK